MTLPPKIERWRRLVGAELVKVAARHRYTPTVDLVLAIIATESSGDPGAVHTEPDGRVSRGLMQMLEGTARDLGLLDPNRLHDPDVSVSLGAEYLARQLDRYQGNTAAAVAAYNAGSARFTESEQFVNQRYVDRVLHWFEQSAPAGLFPFALAAGAALAVIIALTKARGRA